MGATELATAVTNRVNSPILITLTNNDSTPPATSVNNTRLVAACEDALGKFEALTGTAGDTSNYIHLSILVGGVLYFLELYKSREGALISQHSKQFFSECQSLREKAVAMPHSNSKYSPSQEATGSLPDMDKARKVMGTKGSTFSYYGTFEGDI